MADVVVQAERVSKRYRIGEDFQSYDTLRDALERAVLRRRKGARRRDIWALRDVSLEVERGQVLGIVGANGSGKTTLLKLVSRITQPTEGVVRTRERAGAILEIGTGFHPELTGSENIYLNAAVLGMSRRDARKRFDEIVEFAGFAQFLDTPLKRYSTGMRLRLAFSIAAHVEPEILAVDEVLAVGDAEFQRRCLGKMSELQQAGRTVLFVSHDHGAITRLCTNAIWLDGGRVRAEGDAASVVERYLGSISEAEGSVELGETPGVPAFVRSVSLLSREGETTAAVQRGEPLEFHLLLEAARRVTGLDVALYVVNAQGIQVLEEAWLDQQQPVLGAGRTRLSLEVPGVLAPGSYVAGVWVGDHAEAFQHQEALPFDILARPEDPVAEWRNRIAQPTVVWSATSLGA